MQSLKISRSHSPCRDKNWSPAPDTLRMRIKSRASSGAPCGEKSAAAAPSAPPSTHTSSRRGRDSPGAMSINSL
jgi:hypothetical protein